MGVIFTDSARSVLMQIGLFLPKLIAVILVFVLGWLIARIAAELIKKFLKLIKVEQLADSVGINSFLAKGGIKHTFTEVIGILVYWLLLLVVLVISVDILGLTAVGGIIEKIVTYVPNVIAALFIMILGIFSASFLSSSITAALANAGVDQANFLGKASEVIILIFTTFIAIEQLGIAKQTLVFVVSIIFASLGLAFGLAFGLGCKDIAGRFMESFIEKLKIKK